MAWLGLETLALDFDTGVAPARAHAITRALARHAVPLLALRAGRGEPLASGALFRLDGRLVLVTCRHIFDAGAQLGDLGVPLPGQLRVLWLSAARARVLAHPQHDLALIEIVAPAASAALLRGWEALPLALHDAPADLDEPGDFVVAGFPYGQMRRIDGALHARPVVFFARQCSGAALRLRYANVARRVDGMDVHAPELDGVSGATLWRVMGAADAAGCVLRPAGVQCAFKRGAYARAEPLAAAREMFAQIAAR